MERMPDMQRAMERRTEVRLSAKPEWEKRVLNWGEGAVSGADREGRGEGEGRAYHDPETLAAGDDAEAVEEADEEDGCGAW